MKQLAAALGVKTSVARLATTHIGDGLKLLERSGEQTATAGRKRAAPSVAGNGRSLTQRWAADIVKGCAAEQDPRTLRTWARTAATSTTMISERCAMLGIKPHDARDLTRAIFAMLKAAEQQCAPDLLLDIADSRTLRGFRRKAGPAFQSTRDLDSLNRFLDSQAFVDPCNFGVTVLRSQLAKLLSDQAPSD